MNRKRKLQAIIDSQPSPWPTVRRLDLLGMPRTGTVIWMNDAKGHGRIKADDGEWLWFHFSSVTDSSVKLGVGDQVTFVWEGSVADRGVHAADAVHLASATPSNGSVKPAQEGPDEPGLSRGSNIVYRPHRHPPEPSKD